MDLFSILDEWLIPIALIELFVFGNIAIWMILLQGFGVI
jgi:hypothetical protein